MTPTKSEIKEILEAGYTDPVYFLKMFLSHWFPDQIPWFHRAIISILTGQVDFLVKYGELDKIIEHFVWRDDPWDDQSPAHPMFKLEDGKITLTVTKHTLIMLPRGFSKTTLLNGISLYCIVYELLDFFIYVSESAAHASTQLGNIKREITANPMILTLVGHLRPSNSDDEKWQAEYIELLNGIAIAAKGSGSQIRGLNVNAKRPKRILLDDVEDRKEVQNPNLREDKRQWFYRDVMPALALRDEQANIIMLGTLLHNDSLAVTVSRDPRFNTVILSALLENGEALWPEHMGIEKLDAAKDAAIRAGDLSGYHLEYNNKLRDEGSAKFRQKDFIYDPEVSDDLVRAIAIDPALSPKRRASHCVIAVVAMNIKTGKLHVLDIWGKRGPDAREIINKYFELSLKWKCSKHGVESIAFQSILVHLFREEMFRHRPPHYFEIEEIKHSGEDKKEPRIHGILQPRYTSGYMRHRVRFPELEGALLDFPKGQMDYPDAVAMAVTLLDPYAAAAADETKDLGDDEYEEMENWRTY